MASAIGERTAFVVQANSTEPGRSAIAALARISHHGQARHRARRAPIRQEKAAERSLGYGQGLRRRGWPGGRYPSGGGYRTTCSVKALARCNRIALRTFPNLSCDIHRAAPVHGGKSGLGDVVRVRVFIAARDDFARAAPVIGSYFRDIRPANTTVLAALVDERMKIEIEVTARVALP